MTNILRLAPALMILALAPAAEAASPLQAGVHAEAPAAKKNKCEEGYTYDEESGKCVAETRGSH